MASSIQLGLVYAHDGLWSSQLSNTKEKFSSESIPPLRTLLLFVHSSAKYNVPYD